MDSLLQQWFDEVFSRLLLHVATGDGPTRSVVFLLVAARLTGFFCMGPLLGRPILTWPARIALVTLLTMIVAPNLQPEWPDALRRVQDASPDSIIRANHESESRFESVPSPKAVSSHFDFSPIGIAVAVLCDVGIGAGLGLAIALFLSGLKLSGEWLDRHSGLGMGSVLNPEYSSGGSAPAELIFCFCVIVMLVMDPVNGHLLVVRFLLDSFQAIPVGLAHLPQSVFELMQAMVQQSLILGLRIAMPFVVAMSLLDMTLGFVRRSSRWELAPAACAFRTAAALLILAATLPGIQEAATSSGPESLKIAGDKLAVDELPLTP